MSGSELSAELARAAEMTPVTADAVAVLSWWDIVLLKIGGLINPFWLGLVLTCLIGFPIFLLQSIQAFRDPIEIEELADLRSCKNDVRVSMVAEVSALEPVTIWLPKESLELHPLLGLETEAFVYAPGDGQLPGDDEAVFVVNRRGMTGSWRVGSEHIDKLPERFRAIGRNIGDDPIILVPFSPKSGAGKWLLVALAGITGVIGLGYLLALTFGLRDAIRMIRSPDICARMINEELGLSG